MKNLHKLLTLVFIMCLWVTATAQMGTLTGTITGEGEPLIGASVIVSGTTKGTTTDFNGAYTLSVEPGTYNIEVSYIGFATQTLSTTITAGGTTSLDVALSEGLDIDEVIVIGTRASNRTNTESPVPVDVIDLKKLSVAAPQTNLNQLLHFTAPSFSSNTQTISDGTDHIDPASLRGLGPDQVLVLVNGKRRHTSSLVNVNGTFGRGNVGTDLNAIPTTAIKNIEVLRDGAAAQYGSDAIAGVINLNLKKAVNELSVVVNTGGNFTSNIGPFGGETKSIDGEVINVGVNYGLPLGNNGGYINFTGETGFRGSTNRMQRFEGGIFNGYNSVEWVANNARADLASLSMGEIQNFAQSVSHFSGALKTDIMNAATMADLVNLLDFDTTDEELQARGLTREDFNMRVGQSELREGKAFFNMGLPLGEDLELYAFGGMSYRDGESGCFYRLPSQNRTTTSIYINGTVPRINSAIRDQSVGGGIKGKIGEWNIDFSNVFGRNNFIFNMNNTHNATLGSSSPVEFNSGGHSFTQNTSNFDVAQYFDLNDGSGINVAFGAEYRFENFEVIPGTELSFGNFDVNGNLVNPATPSNLLTSDFYGRSRPSGAQCFAGFLPTNEVSADRSNVAGYLDLEYDVNEAFLIGGAVRFENYSDFGSTLNFKLATRYKVNNNFMLRGAVSTGFRAPSLHQIHFSRTSTIFELINGVSVPVEVGTFSNTSRAANLLGIPSLKEETSQNFSVGFTAKVPSAGLRFTVDAYQVNIDDRVVLTGRFSAGSDAELQAIFANAGADAAAFFANAINTQSQGIDLVISHSTSFGAGRVLRNDFAATLSRTRAEQDDNGDVIINASPLLEEKGLVDTYFDQTSRIYLEQAVPRTKLTLSHTLNWDKFTVYLRNTYFGETTEATGEAIFDTDLNQIDTSVDPYNAGKVLTDLSFGYSFTEDLSVTIGANNLLDIYPDEADSAFRSSGRFVYSRRSPQFSFGGRHLFARLAFTLK